MSEHTKRAARHALIEYGKRCGDLQYGFDALAMSLIVDLLVALHDDDELGHFPIQGTAMQALELALAETQPEED